MTPRTFARRASLTAAGILAALVLSLVVGIALHWPRNSLPQTVAMPVAAHGPQAASDRDAGIERLTQAHLAQLEDHLAAELVREWEAPGHWQANLRTAAIGLTMSGPLAEPSQRFLIALGDDADLRRGLFFVMPLVRWMSEPFLFPLPAGGGDGDGSGTMTPLVGLMDERAADGIVLTLDNVGDASHSAAESAAYRNFYASLFRAYGQCDRQAPLHVSLKLSALVHDLPTALGDGGAAKRKEILGALRWLLWQAHGSLGDGFFIRIDMEEYAYKDLTLALFRDLVESSPDLVRDADGRLRIGIVTQAYLRDSAQDLAGLAAWAREQRLRVPVRLVKGAYERHEKQLALSEQRKSPVWHFKPSTDASYEALTQYLLQNADAFEPALATHNLRSQAHVLAVAQRLGVPAEGYELQMLYGMGEPLKQVLVDLGYRLREYVPAGPLHRGLGYAGRRFQELASRDNALSRSLHGDFSVVATRPAFQGAEDIADGAFTLALLNGGHER